jgi:hypothetical protein
MSTNLTTADSRDINIQFTKIDKQKIFFSTISKIIKLNNKQ